MDVTMQGVSKGNFSDILPTHRSLYYGGEWHASKADTRLPIIDPATGNDLGTAEQAGPEDVDLAVKAASSAWIGWRNSKPDERAALLRKCAEIIQKNADDLALIDALDGGNPIAAMRYDIDTSVAQLQYFAGLTLELKGETIPLAPDRIHFTVRQPIGVVAKIGAYNHPFMFTAAKMAAPLASGNTVIMKPPEQAPLSSLRLAELLDGIFPPGVLNILPGGSECGAALSSHQGVAKVALIGSVPTGKAILRAASDTIKPVGLELGGKNALIGFPDCDPGKVADAAIKGMNFSWCGQSCGSTSRVFLHESIYDAALNKIISGVGAFKPGIPTDPSTSMGAIISSVQLQKILKYIKWGIEDGALLVAGGKQPDNPLLASGYFVEPTIFSEVTPKMRIAREEIFGPVMSVFKWSESSEMLRIVNDVPYGLTCSIWTNDIATAHETANAVDAGFVWINDVGSHYLGVPFAGWKQSGMGQEECLAEMMSYTRIKAINLRLRS